MSLPTIVSRATLSDAAGLYTAYTFSDGHVETDPPNRPLSKEDLQRQIRDQLAQTKATQSLANDRGRYTKSQAQKLAPNAQQIARAEFDVITGGLVTKALSTAIRNFTQFAPTATAQEGQVGLLVSSVPLGGDLDDPNAVEYASIEVLAAEQGTSHKNYAIERRPLELKRERA